MPAKEPPALPSEDPDPPTVSKVLDLLQLMLYGLWFFVVVWFGVKEWMYGRNLRYDFSHLPSSQLNRADFEEEFTRRVEAKGYKVFYFRVSYQHPDHTYNAAITLHRVPTNISEDEASEALRQVRASFTTQNLTVEQGLEPTMTPNSHRGGVKTLVQ